MWSRTKVKNVFLHQKWGIIFFYYYYFCLLLGFCLLLDFWLLLPLFWSHSWFLSYSWFFCLRVILEVPLKNHKIDPELVYKIFFDGNHRIDDTKSFFLPNFTFQVEKQHFLKSCIFGWNHKKFKPFFTFNFNKKIVSNK